MWINCRNGGNQYRNAVNCGQVAGRASDASPTCKFKCGVSHVNKAQVLLYLSYTHTQSIQQISIQLSIAKQNYYSFQFTNYNDKSG